MRGTDDHTFNPTPNIGRETIMKRAFNETLLTGAAIAAIGLAVALAPHHAIAASGDGCVTSNQAQAAPQTYPSQLTQGAPQDVINKTQLAQGAPQDQINKSQLAAGAPQDLINKTQLAQGAPQGLINQSQLAQGAPQDQINKSQLAAGAPQDLINKTQLAQGAPQSVINQAAGGGGAPQSVINQAAARAPGSGEMQVAENAGVQSPADCK